MNGLKKEILAVSIRAKFTVSIYTKCIHLDAFSVNRDHQFHLYAKEFCIRKPFLLGYVVKVVHRSMDA